MSPLFVVEDEALIGCGSDRVLTPRNGHITRFRHRYRRRIPSLERSGKGVAQSLTCNEKRLIVHGFMEYRQKHEVVVPRRIDTTVNVNHDVVATVHKAVQGLATCRT